jgi:putative endonuclease
MTLRTIALGRRGELLAARFLVRLGARVLARNYRCRLGEADLIVEHEGDIVIVEVKTTSARSGIRPEDHVTFAKLKRLERVLTRYAQQFGHLERGWRIDVVAVEIENDGTVSRLEHLRNASL